MPTKKYHIIIGTKAQLVKMAPVMLAMDKYKIEYVFVLTGQHQETMSDLIFSFSLKKPDIILFQKHESDTPTKLLKWLFLCSKSAWKLRKQFKNSKGFIVHGDTLSTLWAAVFARLLNIKVIHVEAGLRSYNNFDPFPEELIRIAVTKLSQVLFAGGQWAKDNLTNNSNKLIIDTQFNTILDSLTFALNSSRHMTASEKQSTRFIVVSIHRTENILSKKQFSKIMHFISASAKVTKVKMILHPVTRRRLQETHWYQTLEQEGVELIPRMNYIKFMQLLNNSSGLITDGGSNQEEAALLGLPCLLMRKNTERKEGLDSNIILSKLDNEVIESFVYQTTQNSWKKKALPNNSPSEIIVKHLSELI